MGFNSGFKGLRTLRMTRKKGNALEGEKILKAEGEAIYEDTVVIHSPLNSTV